MQSSKYIHRSLEPELLRMSKAFPVILICGPRQSGKSTLLQYINQSKAINHVTLDDLRERTMAQEDPELFLRTHETPLIIDEFQHAPGLLSYIKIEVDKRRQANLFENAPSPNGLYFLTGSQVFQTMEDVSESLAGRVGILDLHPLSTREIYGLDEPTFIPDKKYIDKVSLVPKLSTRKLFGRIIRGGYPELYRNKSLKSEEFYASYIRTYMERDVRKLINIKDEAKFLHFISSVAVRTGQEYNATEIANDVGVKQGTIDAWMSILKNTFLVYLLQPYSNNNLTRIVKRPKIYFMDTGLACYLAGYFDAGSLEKSAFSGAIFETYVVSEIIKSFANNVSDPRHHLFYYRDNRQREIDLVITSAEDVYPVEIKKSASPSSDAAKNFEVVSRFNLNNPTGYVVCLSDSRIALDDKNSLLPLEYI